MNKHLFRSGFCGIILVRQDDGSYARRTWGEKSHLRCPGFVNNYECECNCHYGEEPWTANGHYEGHRAVVLEPLKYMEMPEEPHRQERPHKTFTQVKKERESMSDALSDMQKALDELATEEPGLPKAEIGDLDE